MEIQEIGAVCVIVVVSGAGGGGVRGIVVLGLRTEKSAVEPIGCGLEMMVVVIGAGF